MLQLFQNLNPCSGSRITVESLGSDCSRNLGGGDLRV